MNISLKILLLLISSVIFTWIFVLHVPKGGGGAIPFSYLCWFKNIFCCEKMCHPFTCSYYIHLHVWLDNSSKHTFKFTARLTTWYRVDSLLGITVIYIHAFNYRLLLCFTRNCWDCRVLAAGDHPLIYIYI